MLPQHGWKPNPSPRRGFTLIESAREVTAPPVVAAVTASPLAFKLFRTAVDEAIARSLDLVVLDCGTRPLSDRIKLGDDSLGPRDQATLRTLWSNPHVRVVRSEPIDPDLEAVLAFCEKAGAALLVLGADHLGSSVVDLDRVFNCDFDVLVATGHQPGVDTPVTADAPEHEKTSGRVTP